MLGSVLVIVIVIVIVIAIVIVIVLVTELEQLIVAMVHIFLDLLVCRLQQVSSFQRASKSSSY